MKELLTYIAQSLVDHPEQVEVTEQTGDGEITLEHADRASCGAFRHG